MPASERSPLGPLVSLGKLPRIAAGTLVALVRSDLTEMDHAEDCDCEGTMTETCTVCAIAKWTREVNVR